MPSPKVILAAAGIAFFCAAADLGLVLFSTIGVHMVAHRVPDFVVTGIGHN
jgi:hypothetical protein